MSCDESPANGITIGHVLAGSWELTEKIFRNLSFRQVARIRSVCKLWADVGTKILDKRRKLHYMTAHPDNLPTTEGKILGGKPLSLLFEEFFNYIVSKPCLCIAFCNEEWLLKKVAFEDTNEGLSMKDQGSLAHYLLKSLPTTCEFQLVSASGIIGTVEQSYQGYLVDSANEANREILSLLAKTKDDVGEEEGSPRKKWRKSRSSDSVENKRESIHKDECNASSSNEAVCDRKEKSSVGYSIEVEARINQTGPWSDAASVLLIPHHPGVKLKFFHTSEESFYKEYRNNKVVSDDLHITTNEFNSITSLSSEDDLKALFLFDVGIDESFTGAFLQSAIQRQNFKLAIGGGVVEGFDSGKDDPQRDMNQSVLGLTVCGPNVLAASIIIPKYVANPKTVDDFMLKLKSCNLPEDQSIAFMYSCCCRGYSFYRRRGNPFIDYNNVETKAFRKMFPKTPIFGFFGGGEIGRVHLPKFSEQSQVGETDEITKNRKRKLFHQFTTVIVLLSFL